MWTASTVSSPSCPVSPASIASEATHAQLPRSASEAGSPALASPRCTCCGWIDLLPPLRRLDAGESSARARVVLVRPPGAAVSPASVSASLERALRSVIAAAAAGEFHPVVALPFGCVPSEGVTRAIERVVRAGGVVLAPAVAAPGSTSPYPAALAQRLEGVIPVGGDCEPGPWRWLARSRLGALRLCGHSGHVEAVARRLCAHWRRLGTLAQATQALRQDLSPRVPASRRIAPVLASSDAATMILDEAAVRPREGLLEVAFRWPERFVTAAAEGLLTFRAFGGPGGLRLHVQANGAAPWGIDLGEGGPYTVVERLPARMLRAGLNVVRFAATEERSGAPASVRVQSLLVQPTAAGYAG